jgi:hypothetical protein
MIETWKEVSGYEGYYEVSDLGDVRNSKTRKILKQTPTKGYGRVTLCKDSKRKDLMVHKIVAQNFLNHIPNGFESVVDHITRDKLDNKVSNLQVISQRENIVKDTDKENTSSKYIGVSYQKSRNLWTSMICINGKSKWIGRFKTEYEAHLAYENEKSKL